MEPQTNPSPDSDGPPKEGIDKTIVEGSGPKPSDHSPLSGGGRFDATSLGATNPYANKGSAEIPEIGKLPSGDEKIPLGSGTIAGLLGTGGMARVYKIWNEKLEVFRAVKILLPSQQKELKDRFETEAKITAKLHHPNIAEIYNVGDWNGLPYLEMEYIDGDSLEYIICKNGKLPFAVCSSIGIFISRALMYAHSQEFLIYGKNYHGVIHRDLKPANIMIARNGNVRLMDFGIARPTEASLHTVEGNIVGTMQYLSPEQIDGVDIDSRTDIYSFGTILYEMLTGVKTFPQETITNLMRKKISNEYRRFSDFSFAVTPGLAKATQKCLQLSKENRYPSAKALLDELEAAHRTITAEEPGDVLCRYLANPDSFEQSGYIKKRQVLSLRLRRLLVPAIGLLTAALVAGGILVIMAGREKAPPKPVATSPAPAPLPAVPPAPLPREPAPPSGELKPLSPATPPPAAEKTVPERASVKQAGRTPALKRTVSQTPTVSPVNGIDLLKKKYGSNDPSAIARDALKAGNPAEAIIALENCPDNAVDQKIKTLLLLEAYIEARRTKDALFIANSQNIQDADFDYLCGRLYQILGKLETALGLYESSLTKPSSIRNRSEIRNDALYYTALVRSDIYRKEPSADSREQSFNAWNVVKRMYGATPDSPRYKEAIEQLTTTK